MLHLLNCMKNQKKHPFWFSKDMRYITLVLQEFKVFKEPI